MAEKFRGFVQGDVLELRLNGSPTPLTITETDDEWIDGQVRMLTRGVDFVQDRRGMASRIRSAAKTRGFAVSIGHREMPNGTEVIVVGPRRAVAMARD